MNEYVSQQLEKLQPLATAGMDPKEKLFRVKIVTGFGATHWISIDYHTYIKIGQALLESE